MTEPISLILAFVKGLLPSLLGALLSLRFLPGDYTNLQKLSYFGFGVVVSYYFGGGLVEYFQAKDITADCFKVAMGMFGYSVSGWVYDRLQSILDAIVSKFKGGN